MALCEIGDPNAALCIQHTSDSMHVVEPPWGDLGRPKSDMVQQGLGFSREFEGGLLSVNLTTRKLHYGRTVDLW